MPAYMLKNKLDNLYRSVKNVTAIGIVGKKNSFYYEFVASSPINSHSVQCCQKV